MTKFFFEQAITAYLQHISVNSTSFSKFKARALLFFALSVAALGFAFYRDGIELISEEGWQTLASSVETLYSEGAHQ
jgi:hypothetical protein